LANTHRNFLLAFFTPFITGAIDFRYGYVFAGTNILGGLIVYFFVIEGQGRTLEEIDTMYLMGVKPWESAKWVVPSLEEMDAKTRERLEAANPELAIQREAGVGADAGADAGGLKATEGSDGSEAVMTEKREENGV
jgi:SP family sugar:H+ symporter-like MFS transporter